MQFFISQLSVISKHFDNWQDKNCIYLPSALWAYIYFSNSQSECLTATVMIKQFSLNGLISD